MTDLDSLIYTAYCDALPARRGGTVKDYSELPDWPHIVAELLADPETELLADYAADAPGLDKLLVAIVRGAPLTADLAEPIARYLASKAEAYCERYELIHEFDARYDQELADRDTEARILARAEKEEAA